MVVYPSLDFFDGSIPRQFNSLQQYRLKRKPFKVSKRKRLPEPFLDTRSSILRLCHFSKELLDFTSRCLNNLLLNVDNMLRGSSALERSLGKGWYDGVCHLTWPCRKSDGKCYFMGIGGRWKKDIDTSIVGLLCSVEVLLPL